MNSVELSLPKSKTVRGYEIKRMPLGAYLQALQLMQEFPRDVAAKMLPNGNVSALLEQLKTLDREATVDLILRALAIIPEQLMGLIARLTGIARNKLLNDPEIGADGLAEIIDAWLEVNGAENFIRAAAHAGQTITTLAAALKTGSKG